MAALVKRDPVLTRGQGTAETVTSSAIVIAEMQMQIWAERNADHRSAVEVVGLQQPCRVYVMCSSSVLLLVIDSLPYLARGALRDT